jgi:DNA-binding transcriptional MerR regulator
MTATITDEVHRALDRLRRQDAAVPESGVMLSIAETAERTGVSAHTLRYYERVGLLDVARDPAGHRVYGAGDFARVVFLSRLRMTGMPIRALQRYVALVAEGEATVPERLAMLQEHRDAVRAQLQELVFALETVEFKIASYGGACAP